MKQITESVKTVESLCDKFGVTAEYLVNELFRYHTTMSKIGLVFWSVVCVLSILFLVVFFKKIKEWYGADSWWFYITVMPSVFFIFISAVAIPCIIINLLKWYASPVGRAIEIIVH